MATGGGISRHRFSLDQLELAGKEQETAGGGAGAGAGRRRPSVRQASERPAGVAGTGPGGLD